LMRRTPCPSMLAAANRLLNFRQSRCDQQVSSSGVEDETRSSGEAGRADFTVHCCRGKRLKRANFKFVEMNGERGGIRTCGPCLKRALDRNHALYVSIT